MIDNRYVHFTYWMSGRSRRAKMKQAEAKTVSKSARGLGRHG